jgi:hypothetical protein
LENGDTNGKTDGTDFGIETDFLNQNARISSKKIKKNPFQS